MDTKAYISSGILEQYALGSVSEQEHQEVECMSHIYPEIRLELDKLQRSLESFAEANAVEPSTALKGRVMDTIEDVSQFVIPSTEPAAKASPIQSLESDAESKETKVIPMYMRLSIAASIAIAIAFGGLWFQSNSQNKAAQSELANTQERLNAEKDALLAELEMANLTLEKKESLNAFFAHNKTQKVHLAGTESSPSSEVNVYWNTQTKAVVMKLDDLPQPANDKQYQLWAIVDGKPTDMGVFDFESAVALVQEMPYEVANAQAFAITLEKKGGSVEPTLSNMYVYGAVAS